MEISNKPTAGWRAAQWPSDGCQSMEAIAYAVLSEFGEHHQHN